MCSPISHGMVDFQSHVSTSKSKPPQDQWRKVGIDAILTLNCAVQHHMILHTSRQRQDTSVMNGNHKFNQWFIHMNKPCVEWFFSWLQNIESPMYWVTAHIPCTDICGQGLLGICRTTQVTVWCACGSDVMSLPWTINTGDSMLLASFIHSLSTAFKIHCGTDMSWHICWSTSI